MTKTTLSELIGHRCANVTGLCARTHVRPHTHTHTHTHTESNPSIAPSSLSAHEHLWTEILLLFRFTSTLAILP